MIMKSQNDEARLDRLPRWASDEIRLLRNTVDALRRELQVGPENSNAFLRPYGENPTPLGTDPVIHFRAGGDGLDGYTVQFKDGALFVQGMAPAHDDYLGVFPMSGNYVQIKHVKKDG